VKREWKYFDLYCHNCGNAGTLGIWTEQEGEFVRWDGEWKGFFGVTDRENPHVDTLTCAVCRNEKIEVKSVPTKDAPPESQGEST
jgi:hypothetical protein